MMARALADAGATRVYIVGRRVDVIQEAANSIGKPTVVVPLYCDVASKVSLEALVSMVEADVGYLNLLVCNAGIGGPQVKAPDSNTTIDEVSRCWRLDASPLPPTEIYGPATRISGRIRRKS